MTTSHPTPHPIAGYFSLAARTSAAEHTYKTWECPLGVLCTHDYPDEHVFPTPGRHALTRVLDRAYPELPPGFVGSLAGSFARAWDRGDVTDLYAALGVERGEVQG